jgi:hypothetical protein
MKTINMHLTETERVPQLASWPECVEQSYDRLIAAITNFVAVDEAGNARVELATINSFAI